MFPAARPASILPTAVDPVKVSLRTFGLVTNSSPTGAGSSAVTKLTTPLGKPASSNTRKVSIAVSGVASAGFRTTVQPAASAGPSFRVIIEIG